MPNWCMNKLLVEGEKEDILYFAKHVSGTNGILDFEKAMPVPDDCIKVRDWCTENWGTKWTPTCEATPTEDEELYRVFKDEIFFDTAWTPPIEFFHAMSKQFPKLNFHLYFLEIGCAFAGEVEWVQGNCERHCEYDDPSDSYKHIAEDAFCMEVGDDND